MEHPTVIQPGRYAQWRPDKMGKTTLFHLMTGFHRPTAGEVRFGGRSLAGLRPHQV